MGVILLITVLIFLGVIGLGTWCIIAYNDGRDDAQYEFPYENAHPLPAAYFYDVGYRHGDKESNDSLSHMNKVRFNRDK